MNPQAKLWICAFVVLFDIGIVLYFAWNFPSEPLLIVGVAALMILSSIHVVLTIWFGEKWFSHPEVRGFLKRITGQSE